MTLSRSFVRLPARLWITQTFRRPELLLLDLLAAAPVANLTALMPF